MVFADLAGRCSWYLTFAFRLTLYSLLEQLGERGLWMKGKVLFWPLMNLKHKCDLSLTLSTIVHSHFCRFQKTEGDFKWSGVGTAVGERKLQVNRNSGMKLYHHSLRNSVNNLYDDDDDFFFSLSFGQKELGATQWTVLFSCPLILDFLMLMCNYLYVLYLGTFDSLRQIAFHSTFIPPHD